MFVTYSLVKQEEIQINISLSMGILRKWKSEMVLQMLSQRNTLATRK